MNFDIKTEKLDDDRYVISLAGEVDLYTAPEFKQQLLEVISQGGKNVIVDFSDTTFIDSTTLGVLVGGVKRLRSNDGQLSLVCSDRNITKIFEITGLDRVFTIYATRDEAVAANGVRAGARVALRARLAAIARAAAALVAAAPGAARSAASRRRRSSRGEELFAPAAAAARCHTLADAGTQGRDRAEPRRGVLLRASAEDDQGFDESTIRDVVRGQIAYPVEDPPTGAPGMPANLVTGEDADAVAAYVASVAGRARCGAGGRRRAGAAPDGAAIFTAAGCGGCHTLAAAGLDRHIGPNLDDAKPTRSSSIDRVTNGQGAMPPFKDQLNEEQIDAVAATSRRQPSSCRRSRSAAALLRLAGCSARVSRSASRSTTTCVIGTAKRSRAARDDAALEPVRAALGMRRDDDLVGAEHARVSSIACSGSQSPTSPRASTPSSRSCARLRSSRSRGRRARAVLVRGPVPQRRVQRGHDDEHALAEALALLADASRAAPRRRRSRSRSRGSAARPRRRDARRDRRHRALAAAAQDVQTRPPRVSPTKTISAATFPSSDLREHDQRRSSRSSSEHEAEGARPRCGTGSARGPSTRLRRS